MQNQKSIKKGILYLIPSLLGAEASPNTLPQQIIKAINQVDILLAEKPKTTRILLKRIPIKKPIQEFDIQQLNIHTTENEIENYIKLLQSGKIIGIIPEAGCPGVADPGTSLIQLAHKHNITVIPLVGPCSVLLALMGSGLNGQNFSFLGYLPKQKQKRIKKIIELEKISSKSNQTQIFIEAPYRSHHLFNDLVKSLEKNTNLSIAVDLTLSTEFVATKTISQWRKIQKTISLKNKYVVFLINANI